MSCRAQQGGVNQYSFDGMTVTKIGAATGSTTGVIISSRCTALNMSHLIAVRCPNSSQKFADRCDGGALVVGRSGPHDTDPDMFVLRCICARSGEAVPFCQLYDLSTGWAAHHHQASI